MTTLSLPMGHSGAIKSEPIYGFRILRDVKIPMRDGVKLSANIFLPDTEGRFPVIFERMPYGASGCDQGEFYARRGYVFVMQDCRGRHDSEGEFYPFRDDTPDGLDSLDWICAQPWSNGRVGMFGPSYLGGVQWAVAGERQHGPRARSGCRVADRPADHFSQFGISIEDRASGDSFAGVYE